MIVESAWESEFGGWLGPLLPAPILIQWTQQRRTRITNVLLLTEAARLGQRSSILN
jgi:hypothetical protein